MTAKELADLLNKVVADGHGDCDVLFDTEARTFNYHMAKVGSAFFENEAYGRPVITLHEAWAYIPTKKEL